MDGKSFDIVKEKRDKLRDIIPEAFTENKIDWEKLKAALGDDIEFKNERYVLNWAGKSDAFRALQSPSTATLAPCKEESVNFDATGNIFIEGENLEVLKVLQKSYFGKIKMIYIDPPYNTGNDNFIYPDRFAESKEEYLSRIGDKDEAGLMTREGLFRKNSKDSGHYHSNWLSMMYPRLFLARNLLRNDGVIFVSIDDNEVHNLRLLMNEVFGEENFIVLFSRMMKSGGAKGKFYTPNIDYILAYSKSILETSLFRLSFTDDQIDRFYTKTETKGPRKGEIFGEERLYKASLDPRPNQRYYIKCPDGTFVIPPGVNFPKNIHEGEKVIPTSEDGVWKWIYERYYAELNAGNIVFKETSTSALVNESGKRSKWNIYNKLWLTEQQDKGVVPSNFIADYENRQSAAELKSLDIPFDFAKPVNLIKYLLELVSRDGEAIILDFFAGSCTTAHAVLALNKEDGGNRKFICVQLPEKCDKKSEAFKAGYKTIAEIGKERIRRVVKKFKEEYEGKLDLEGGKKDLGFKVFKLKESNFKIWRSNIETEEELITQMQQHLEPLDEHAKTEDVLHELLIKSGVPLTAAIEVKDGYFLANGNEIALMLEKAANKIIKQIIAQKPQKVFTLDRLFKNNDKLKTNTALQMKDAGIKFSVV